MAHLQSADAAMYKATRAAVAAVAMKIGFTKAEKEALDEMTVFICTVISSISSSSRALSELACRSHVNSFDLLFALKEFNVVPQDLLETMDAFPNPTPVAMPKQIVPPDGQIRIGDDRPMPAYIPSFLPKFPNPHTFVSTEVTADVETSYSKARTLQAFNARNAENSLLRYALSTQECFCLFVNLHEELKEKARNELEMQRAEWEMRAARSDGALGIPEQRDTELSIIRKELPDFCFVLKPFPVADPTMLALCDVIEEEPEVAHANEEAVIPSGGDNTQLGNALDELMLSDNSGEEDNN